MGDHGAAKFISVAFSAHYSQLVPAPPPRNLGVSRIVNFKEVVFDNGGVEATRHVELSCQKPSRNQKLRLFIAKSFFVSFRLPRVQSSIGATPISSKPSALRGSLRCALKLVETILVVSVAILGSIGLELLVTIWTSCKLVRISTACI